MEFYLLKSYVPFVNNSPNSLINVSKKITLSNPTTVTTVNEDNISGKLFNISRDYILFSSHDVHTLIHTKCIGMERSPYSGPKFNLIYNVVLLDDEHLFLVALLDSERSCFIMNKNTLEIVNKLKIDVKTDSTTSYIALLDGSLYFNNNKNVMQELVLPADLRSPPSEYKSYSLRIMSGEFITVVDNTLVYLNKSLGLTNFTTRRSLLFEGLNIKEIISLQVVKKNLLLALEDKDEHIVILLCDTRTTRVRNTIKIPNMYKEQVVPTPLSIFTVLTIRKKKHYYVMIVWKNFSVAVLLTDGTSIYDTGKMHRAKDGFSAIKHVVGLESRGAMLAAGDRNGLILYTVKGAK